MSDHLFRTVVIVWILMAIALFPLLLNVVAPYGRHSSKKWGPMIGNRAGWVIMELPSLILFTSLFLTGDPGRAGIKWIFLGVWALHYVNRIFIFPLRTRTRGKKMPLLIIALAMLFNIVNAFLNGYWLGHLSGDFYKGWGMDPRLLAGLLIFTGGFILNQVSDNHLIGLRKDGIGGYSIPTHRVFSKISCPNFAGEILEWTGFAIMTWSLPGLSFAIWTAANLIPRALHHHRWYKNTFPGYPLSRKAIVPGLF